MTKDLKIVIRVDTKTGELKVLTNELDNVTAKANEAKSAFGSIKGKLLALGSAAASIYSISQAFGFVLSSGLEYNKQMDASRAKLRAMISSQKDYITLTGQKVSAMQREKLIAKELNATMTLLKRANAQTAMGMSELIDVYALAKPGMDRANWSLKDQIEILKLVTNTASNFGVSAEELSTGIDDLATGTWDATSGFGKMMKALGITNESFKAAANKVEFLKEKLKETGAMQDTWAVATSNLGVAWDELTGKITAPIFDIAKEGVKELTLYLNGIDSSSVDGVRDSLIELAKAGVTAAAYIKTFWDGVSLVFTVAQVAYYKFGLVVNEGMQNFSEISANVINAVYGYWIGFKNKVKHIWHDIVKYAADVWNGLLESISNSKFGKFIAQKFDISLGGLKIDIAPVNDDPIKDIVKAEDFSAGIDYYKRALISAKNEEFDKYNSLLNKDNFKAADEFIAKIDKIAQKYKDVKKEQDKTINGLQLANKKVSTKGLDDTTKKAKKASSSLKKLKSSAKSAKEQLAGLKEAKDTLFEATHSGYEVELKKLNEEMQKLSKYLDKSDIDKIYQAKLRKMQGFTKEFTDDFKTAFNSMLSGDIKGGIEGLFKSLSTKLMNPLITNVSNSINSWFSSLTGSMGMFEQFGMGGLLAIGGSLLRGLFEGHKLTQAEIDAAKGRVDFSDESLSKLADIIKSSDNVLLPYNKKMTHYLESLNKNFINIAEALNKGSFDYSGSNYAPVQKSGFLGFSSESRNLIGSGIALDNIKLGGSFDGYGYTSEKVQESSFWGLFSDEYIKETKSALDSGLKSEISEVLKTGSNIIKEGAKALGFNVENELQKFSYSLGKIDLKGLSPEDASKRIENALSEVFSKAIDSTDVSMLVDRYKKLNEESLTTLNRIASSYEQAEYLFSKIGKSFDDYVKVIDFFGFRLNKSYTKQMAVLDVVEASGGLDKFNSAFSSYYDNFYSESEKTNNLKRELTDSFASLNMQLPKSKGELKALIEGFEVTDKKSAETYAELLKLSSSFDELSKASKELYEQNIKAAKDKLDYEESLLAAKESLLELEKKIEEDRNNLLKDTLESFKKLSDSLRDLAYSADDTIDAFSLQNKSDSYSFAFNLERLNALEKEFKGYFNTSGVLKDPNSYDKVEGVYKSILTIANNLKGGIDNNPYYANYSDSIKSVLELNKNVLLNNSKIMQVELVGDQIGLAKDNVLKTLWSDFVNNKAGLHTEQSFYDYINAAFNENDGLSKNKNTKAIEEWIKALYGAQIEENKLKLKHLDSSFFEPGAKLYEQSKIDFTKATGYAVDSDKFNDLYETLKAFELKNDKEDLLFAKDLYANNTEIYDKIEALSKYLPDDIKKAFESVVDTQRENIVDSYKFAMGKYPTIDELNNLYAQIKQHSGELWSLRNKDGVAKLSFYTRTPPRPLNNTATTSKTTVDNTGWTDLLRGGIFTSLNLAGFSGGGYTGDIAPDKIAGVVHGQEYVVNAKTTKDLGLNNSAGVFKELLEVNKKILKENKAIKEELKNVRAENAALKREVKKIRDIKEEEVA